MSEVLSAPQWMITKTGEPAGERFLAWVADNKRKLLKAFPKGEQAFCRILDKMRSRLPRRWSTRLWYTRQKHYVVAPGIVFFGDFHFRNLGLLVEIDGHSHEGEVAAEKDRWRSEMTKLWKVRTERLTNDQVLSGDFRQVERWFIEEAATCCPWRVGSKLLADYERVRRKYPDIYAAGGTMTTYR